MNVGSSARDLGNDGGRHRVNPRRWDRHGLRLQPAVPAVDN